MKKTEKEIVYSLRLLQKTLRRRLKPIHHTMLHQRDDLGWTFDKMADEMDRTIERARIQYYIASSILNKIANGREDHDDSRPLFPI